MDKIIEEGCNMIIIIEVTLVGEEILEEYKIFEVKISQLDIEVTIETKTLEEAEVGIEKDSIHIILEKMINVVVYQDQV